MTGAQNVRFLRTQVALGELVDALNDELSYEVAKVPEVQRKVRAALDVLGDGYQSYRQSWWLQ